MTFEQLIEEVGLGLAVVIQDSKGELTNKNLENIKTFDEWYDIARYCDIDSRLNDLAFQKMQFLCSIKKQQEILRACNPFFRNYSFPNHKETRALETKVPEFSFVQWKFIWMQTRGAGGCPTLHRLAMQKMIEFSRM